MISIVIDRVNKEEYATFESVPEMRESVNAHIKTIKASGLKAAWQRKLIALLDYLRDESRVFPGLSFKKQRLIAKHFGLKKPDTVGEWLKKLSGLGIVKVLHTKTSSTMHQTANFVQILPAKIEKRGQEVAKNGEHEVKRFSKTKDINSINTYEQAVKTAPLYVQVKEYIASTIGQNQKLVSAVYGIIRAKKLNNDTMAVLALKTSVQAFKHGSVRTTLPAFFSGTIDRMLTPKEAPKSTKPVREEILPKWFANPQEESMPEVDTDANFLAAKAAFEAELAACK
ncbi:hypothetical protein NLX67_22390 [Domibacillus sp. A3M-37]|uniref:hypothetical protein n=1 Tax=Domibacillus sp. A3M-37 TaxID=2962037 RepID=UPI0020B7C261|nr:hypothetical protein [Domibacillus sp. A3M-37]MCP3765056.1 hypothetical protein [Domibacillus sp. A3M-37]